MRLKSHWLLIFLAFIFLETGMSSGSVATICYNSSLEGFRLNGTVLRTIIVSQRIACVLECATDPCCRAVNYRRKTTSNSDSNCEMLHHVVYSSSERLLTINVSFDHVYLIDPEKKYNASCINNVMEDKDSLEGSGSKKHRLGMTSCNSTKLMKKGCYQDYPSDRALPELLLKYPLKVDWMEGWNDYLYNVTCHCARQAKYAGYRFFGVQFYKQCWAGNLKSQFFNKNAKSPWKCWGVKPDYKQCDDDTGTKCVGTAWYNYIYEIMPDL